MPPRVRGERPPRRSRPWLVIVAAACGLALGIGVTVALTGDDDGQRPADIEEPSALSETERGPVPPGAEAPGPRAAVEGFLDAEIAQDFTTSFGFLSGAARADYGSPERWVAAHADVLPPVRGYEIEQVEEPGDTGERAEVVAMVTFEPSLDQVVGLVPERSRVTWATAGDGGSWGVDIGASTFEPLYPPEDAAPGAVQEWARAHQGCGPAPSWGGNLVGSPALAEGLCGTEGAVEVGAPAPVAEVDAGPVLAAFGPEAADWARVVPVTAPVELRAVVAPLGQQWLVVGVLPAG